MALNNEDYNHLGNAHEGTSKIAKLYNFDDLGELGSNQIHCIGRSKKYKSFSISLFSAFYDSKSRTSKISVFHIFRKSDLCTPQSSLLKATYYYLTRLNLKKMGPL